MSKRSILVFIYIASALGLIIKSHRNIKSANLFIDQINNKMEIIEYAIRSNDKKMICQESEDISLLIKNNINSLKRIEPYYLWENINSVLIKTYNQYCKNDS